MNNYLERNLSLLKQTDQELVSRILQTSAAPEHEKVFLVDAETEFKKAMALSKLVYPLIVVIDGFCSGLAVQKIVEHLPKSVKEIIIIERNSACFRMALDRHDFRALIGDDRVRFMVGLEDDAILYWFKKYLQERERLMLAGRIEHVFIPDALGRDGSYFKAASEYMKMAVQCHLGVFKFPPEDSYRGLVNLLDNVPDIAGAKLADAFCGVFSGMTGIVVASGPSLEHHLGHLKKRMNDCVIACCDGSYRTLIDNGIRPHFVFTMERVVNSARYFNPVVNSDIPLVALPIIHPKTLRSYKGPLIVMNRASAFGEWAFADADQFSIGTTVAHMAFRFLEYSGCSQIALVGQDLAYDPVSNVSHTGGVPEEIKKYMLEMLSDQDLRVVVKANDGGDISSNIYWQQAVREYEGMFWESKVKVINAIPEKFGAEIKNCCRMSPEEFWNNDACFPLSTSDKRKMIESIFSTNEKTCRNLQAWSQLSAQTCTYLKNVSDTATALINRIGRDYNDHLPFINSRQVLDEFMDLISVWDGEMVRILNINPELYMKFLNVFLFSTYVQIKSRRNEMVPHVEKACDYIKAQVHLIQEWLNHLIIWSLRVKQQLEAVQWSAENKK